MKNTPTLVVQSYAVLVKYKTFRGTHNKITFLYVAWGRVGEGERLVPHGKRRDGELTEALSF